MGNGICDNSCNVDECSFDNGDCGGGDEEEETPIWMCMRGGGAICSESNVHGNELCGHNPTHKIHAFTSARAWRGPCRGDHRRRDRDLLRDLLRETATSEVAGVGASAPAAGAGSAGRLARSWQKRGPRGAHIALLVHGNERCASSPHHGHAFTAKEEAFTPYHRSNVSTL